MNMLTIKGLHVETEGKEILKGIDIEIGRGEVVALMGPNGAGKSSLGYAIMGHPSYKITSGRVMFNGENIMRLKPNERAKKGLFLSFQYPSEVTGVSMANFLRTAINSHRKRKAQIPVADFLKKLKETMKMLKMDESFMSRNLNEGFSGGEKKRAEILQMAMLKPKMAILDETDSGLDIDSLKAVAEGIKKLASKETSILLITHYQRILDYIKPGRIYVMKQGKIIKSGGPGLANQIEKKGYGGM